jgi:membrane protein implicated in regulation of membrane protease activity
MVGWHWLAIAFLLCIVEASAPGGAFFLLFGLAALLVALALFLSPWIPLAGQIFLFALFAVLLVYGLRNTFLRAVYGRAGLDGTVGGDVDTLDAQSGIVESVLAPGAVGYAVVRGTRWKVRNVGDIELPEKTECLVCGRDGLMLDIRAK